MIAGYKEVGDLSGSLLRFHPSKTAKQGDQPKMQQPMAPQAHVQNTMSSIKKKGFTKTQAFMTVALFSVAILATLMLLLIVLGGGGKDLASAVKKDQYQAVFLNSQDGQVYFGKLEAYNEQYYRLTDIFYVRVEQKIQPEGQSQQPQQSISLAKLGNELHGPEDEMFVSKEKVLFWENLKDSGQVVTAIRDYKKDPEAAAKKAAEQQPAAGTQQQSTQAAPATPAPTTKKP